MDNLVLILGLHDKILQNMLHLDHIYRNENLKLLSSVLTYQESVISLTLDFLFINEQVLIAESYNNYIKFQHLSKYLYNNKIITKKSIMSINKDSPFYKMLTPKNYTPASPSHSLSSSRNSLNSSMNKPLSIRKVTKFDFSNLDLAFTVRQRVYQLLISFDDNANCQLEEEEIKRALVQILDQSPWEIIYVTKNVFRYDSNNDGMITYQEFTDFCLEQHFGQMAIQRLHKQGAYSKGKQRVMNQKQFYHTLCYCLNFIGIVPQQKVINRIFRQIDQKNTGEITYPDYFTFLKQYFGSKSQSAKEIKIDQIKQVMKNQASDEIEQFFKKKKDTEKQKQDEKKRLQQARRKQKQKEEQLRKKRQQDQMSKNSRYQDQRRKREQEQNKRKRERDQQNNRRLRDEQNRRAQQQQRNRRNSQNQQKRRRQLQQRNRKLLQEQQARKKKQKQEEQRRKNLENQLKTKQNTSLNLSNLNINKSQLSSLCQRVSRLVYHQLKITLMDNDRQFLLCTDKNLANELIQHDIKLSQHQATKITNQYFNNGANPTISYEQLLTACVQYHMTELYPQQILSKYPLNHETFIQQVGQALHFIRAKPIGHILQEIFYCYLANSPKKQLDMNKFKQIMKMIFAGYKWPRRTGQQRLNQNSLLKENRYRAYRTQRI